MEISRGQGATEYLVLLAVVLIIALVGIALLGFFPGTASDAQVAESKIYWQSASPVAITEWDAKYWNSLLSTPYLRLRNTGSYPIRITRLLGANGQSLTQFCDPTLKLFSDYYYLAPGEEAFLGFNGSYPTLPYNRDVDFYLPGSSTGCALRASASICSAAGRGMLSVNDFGFEYVQYVEGQQITKRQVGAKPLMIKCS